MGECNGTMGVCDAMGECYGTMWECHSTMWECHGTMGYAIALWGDVMALWGNAIALWVCVTLWGVNDLAHTRTACANHPLTQPILGHALSVEHKRVGYVPHFAGFIHESHIGCEFHVYSAVNRILWKQPQIVSA